MSAQPGNLFKLAVGSGSGSSITYTSFASARSTDWTISNTQVDVTNIGSAGWTTLLEQAGTQKMAVSLAGVVQEGPEEVALATAAQTNAFMALKFTNGYGDVFTGSFAVSSYKRSGTYNGEEQFTASFDSAAEITFTAGSGS